MNFQSVGTIWFDSPEQRTRNSVFPYVLYRIRYAVQGNIVESAPQRSSDCLWAPFIPVEQLPTHTHTQHCSLYASVGTP